jgi:hypothetical protein
MATFTVTRADAQTRTYVGFYTINDGGVLSVKPEEGIPVVYSTSGWLSLEIEDAPNIFELRGILSV